MITDLFQINVIGTIVENAKDSINSNWSQFAGMWRNNLPNQHRKRE